MVAAPAPAFEHFGKIFQPLLGERTPARDKFVAPCHARTMCHDPAHMRGTDADATANQPDVTTICCGKDFSLSSASAPKYRMAAFLRIRSQQHRQNGKT